MVQRRPFWVVVVLLDLAASLGTECGETCAAGLSLLQRKAALDPPDRRGTAEAFYKLQILQSVAGRTDGRAVPVADCKTSPQYCGSPLHCDKPTFDTDGRLSYDGHANLQNWCSPGMAEAYSSIIESCLIRGDLKAAAQGTFEAQMNKSYASLEADGSYCFVQGLCHETRVGYDTTMEEAEALCDEKFGHDTWTGLRFSDMAGILTTSDLVGGMSREHSKKLLMAACAMGNYHCDAVYCKETYCKMPHFQKKYGHFLLKKH